MCFHIQLSVPTSDFIHQDCFGHFSAMPIARQSLSLCSHTAAMLFFFPLPKSFMFVCLFISDYTKTTKPISTKRVGGMGAGLGNFGAHRPQLSSIMNQRAKSRALNITYLLPSGFVSLRLGAIFRSSSTNTWTRKVQNHVHHSICRRFFCFSMRQQKPRLENKQHATLFCL